VYMYENKTYVLPEEKHMMVKVFHKLQYLQWG
jgi:hypothetical protein